MDGFNQERAASHFKGWNKTMLYHFTDTDDYFLIRIKDGAVEPVEKLGQPFSKPDIGYEMDTATLRAMTRGELSGMQAFQQRRLKVKASFIDMMKLQSLNRVQP